MTKADVNLKIANAIGRNYLDNITISDIMYCNNMFSKVVNLIFFKYNYQVKEVSYG